MSHDDKENAESSSRKVLMPLSSTKSKPLSLSTSIHHSKTVRFGETVETLFLLDNPKLNNKKARTSYSNNVLSNPSSPQSWLKSLDATSKAISRSSEPFLFGPNLIKLHRRATTMLKSSRTTPDFCQASFVNIWLSYANAQFLYGNKGDARMTFRYMKLEKLGSNMAIVYVKNAEFEMMDNNEEVAAEILETALASNTVQPVEDLKRSLLEIKSGEMNYLNVDDSINNSINSNNNLSISAEIDNRKLSFSNHNDNNYNESPSLEALLSDSRGVGGAAVDEEPFNLNDDETPAKGGKKAGHNFDVLSDSEDDTVMFKTNSNNIPATPNNNNNNNNNDTLEIVGLPKKTPIQSVSKKAQMSERSRRRMSIRRRLATNSTPPQPQVLSSIADSPDMTVTFKNAESKTKTRTKITAKAATRSRITPMKALQSNNTPATRQKVDESVDYDDDTPSPVLKSKPNSKPKETEKKTTKITKGDLSYMLNWDPARKKPTTAKQAAAAKSATPAISKKSQDPTMDIIVEESSDKDDSNGSNKTKKTPSPPPPPAPAPPKAKKSNSSQSIHTPKSKSTPQATPQATSTSTSSIVGDFAPLVNSNNMIYVNNCPYAKLGVIGRGGSCKVYRVLSRDFSVLALKRVKLNGMDKKAIDSYANEIALLKRLQGNPAIIQLHDSQVDYNRKAIYLVMEPGEVDLNQVLQQQAALAKQQDGVPRALNMNFIRLTWQQMLGAVHSIHEERIIHGDLKPANFLFVKGALKLIDFGIARAIQSDDTTNIYRDSQVGTLNYMSPEAILDTGSGASGNARMRLGRASDVWSLGCILYQLVYGKTPFSDLHMIPKLQAIVNPNHEINFPVGECVDEAAIDAIKLCLIRKAEKRPPIVGDGGEEEDVGLLTGHWFLHSEKT